MQYEYVRNAVIELLNQYENEDWFCGISILQSFGYYISLRGTDTTPMNIRNQSSFKGIPIVFELRTMPKAL